MRNSHRSILSLLALSLLIWACSPDKEGGPAARPRPLVTVAPVTLGDIERVIRAPGSAQALRDEQVRAPIAGKVADLKGLEGDPVRKGERLVTILPRESDAAIAGARKLLALAATDAQRSEAERALALAERSMAGSVVTAPFDGTISNRLAADGEYVAEGTDLLEIVDNRSIFFAANLGTDDARSAHPGQRAIIRFPTTGSPSIAGTVAAVSPDVDPVSQTVKVRITFDSPPPLLKPGTFGMATVVAAQHESILLVPREAVIHDDELDKSFVVRSQGDTLALLTPVDIGLMDSTHVEILSGLKIDDRVVTVGGYGLPDSTPIRVE